MLQKSAFAFLALPCLFFASSSFAATVIGEKYAPYIGFEHGFSRLSPTYNKSESKYTPRFFVGFSPIQSKNYKFGMEVGYTLPASSKGEYYGYYSNKNHHHDEIVLKINSSDFYLTFYQKLSTHAHWFLKPGVEYIQKQRQVFSYVNHKLRDEYKIKYSPVFLGAQAGIGYNFNNGLGVNLIAHSRFVDLNRHDYPKWFALTMNVRYSF